MKPWFGANKLFENWHVSSLTNMPAEDVIRRLLGTRPIDNLIECLQNVCVELKLSNAIIKPQKPPESTVKIEQITPRQYFACIWQDTKVKIVLPDSPQSLYHLQIKLPTEVKCLDEVEEQQYLGICHALDLIINYYASIGIHDMVVGFSRFPALNQDSFTVDVIPPNLEKDNTLDHYDKAITNQFFLLGHCNLQLDKTGYSSYELAKFRDSCTLYFKQPLGHSSRAKDVAPIDDMSCNLINIGKALELNLNNLEKCLLKANLQVERIQTNTPIINNEAFFSSRLGNPFVDKAVLARQTIATHGSARLIQNYRAFNKASQFLLIPNRHIVRLEGLTEQENIDRFTLIQNTIKLLSAKFHQQTQIHFYTQNGITAGQTVPHTHIQVTLPPNLAYFIDWININAGAFKPIDTKEMSKTQRELQELYTCVVG